MFMVSLFVTMVLAQQQPTTTYLDIGGVFPLLEATGTINAAGVMRQAGKNLMFVIFCC